MDSTVHTPTFEGVWRPIGDCFPTRKLRPKNRSPVNARNAPCRTANHNFAAARPKIKILFAALSDPPSVFVHHFLPSRVPRFHFFLINFPVTFGSPFESLSIRFWTAFGQLLDDFWPAFGHPLGIFCVAFGAAFASSLARLILVSFSLLLAVFLQFLSSSWIAVE